MQKTIASFVLGAAIATASVGATETEEGASAAAARLDRLIGAVSPPAVRGLVREALERSPALDALEAAAAATAADVAGSGALPDPTLGATIFLAPPETRVGPQRFSAALWQELPSGGKRRLRRGVTEAEAAGSQADLDAARLDLVTTVRTLAYEVAFVSQRSEILDEFRAHLVKHEEIARARYSTGVGTGQGVVKLQAEITRVEGLVLELTGRESDLRTRLNALRREPAGARLPSLELPPLAELSPDPEALRLAAASNRPELARDAADIAGAETRVLLVEKEARPDLKLGLTYTFVENRRDDAGRLAPPEGNGDDIFALLGSINLPVRRQRRTADEEAARLEVASARQRLAHRQADIEAAVDELLARLEPIWSRLRLLEDLLIIQAEESLQSAQAGYVTGNLNALDLLDAEHVLFDARTAVARARADYAIAIAQLEGAVGAHLADAGAPSGGER